jgi:tRNA(Ile2) C34 agmatinyltransferase TiaS
MSVHLEKCAVKQCGYVFLMERSCASTDVGGDSGSFVCPQCGARVEADPAMRYITRRLPDNVGDWPEEGTWT